MSVALLICAILGAFVGSFVGVVAERMHTGSSFVGGRSRCNSCGAVLSPLDLVPVLSWLMMLGRCRACGSRVPARYLVVEASMAGLFALSYLMHGLTFPLVLLLVVLTILAAIVLYDLAHTVVPRELSFLLVLASLAYRFAVDDLMLAGLALAVAGLIALGFFLLHALSRGRWMGLGDAPVALALALMAGPNAFAGLLFSFWIGALVGIFILVSRLPRHTMGMEIPFVPFLAAGFLLAYFTSWSPLAFILGW